jgi:hypothetical protein
VLDARILHEGTQSDAALFRRLCPPDSQGIRSFAPIMLRRLQKLGIKKTNPDDLTPEEVTQFARLDIFFHHFIVSLHLSIFRYMEFKFDERYI